MHADSFIVCCAYRLTTVHAVLLKTQSNAAAHMNYDVKCPAAKRSWLTIGVHAASLAPGAIINTIKILTAMLTWTSNCVFFTYVQSANLLDVVHSYCHCGCLWVIICAVDADAGTLHQMLYSAQVSGCLQHGAVLHPGRHVQWVQAHMVLTDWRHSSQGERHWRPLYLPHKSGPWGILVSR